MNNDKISKAGKNGSTRRWSLMLVDDHGRIIPLRRFRAAVVAAVLLFGAAVLALAALGLFHARQSIRLEQMSMQMADLEKQNSGLRDEKDLLLTQLVIRDEQSNRGQPRKPGATEKRTDTPDGQEAETMAGKSAEAEAIKRISAAENINKTPEALVRPEPTGGQTAQPPKPEEKLQAMPVAPLPAVESKPEQPIVDISQFSASYKPERSVLKAAFRLLNKSKQPVSGKVVAVFKDTKSGPAKWLSIPHVELKNGIPDAKSEKSFSMKKFITLELQAYNQFPPVVFDKASVYVFSDNGEMLRTQDFAIDIAYRSGAQPGSSDGPRKEPHGPERTAREFDQTETQQVNPGDPMPPDEALSDDFDGTDADTGSARQKP